MTRPREPRCSGAAGLAFSLDTETYAYGTNVGRRRVKRHVIADIHYGRRVQGVAGFDAPSSLDCKCGTGLSASTPDELADLWRAHGGKTSGYGSVR